MAFVEKFKAWMGYEAEDEEYEYDYEYGVEDNRALAPQPVAREKQNTGVSAFSPASPAQQIVTLSSTRFEDASVVVDYLKSGHTVVLNLQNTNMDVARRMLDFIGGATYARDGQIAQIATGAYIVVPYSVELNDETNRTYF